MSKEVNRYTLTDEVRAAYLPTILAFLEKAEQTDLVMEDDEEIHIDLSDSKLNPSTLCKLLEEMGYKKGMQQDNGWQMDFWIPMYKSNCKQLSVEGQGITFELRLAAKA